MRPAGRAVGQGVRAAAWRSPASRTGCSPARSCCAACGAIRRSGARGRSTATRSGCGASCATDGDDKLVINVWGVGYRLMRSRRSRVDERRDATPRSVVGLYQQLACRAGRAGAGGARARGERRAAVRRERGGARGRRRRAAARRDDVHRARRAAAGPVRRAGRRAAGGRRAVRGGGRPDPRSRDPDDDEGRNDETDPTIGSYRDADGARHEVVVRQTADGDWQVLDTSADGDARRSTRSTATTTAARRPRRSPATTWRPSATPTPSRDATPARPYLSKEEPMPAATAARVRHRASTRARGAALPRPAR